jgi:hypothetical protein
MRGNNVLPLRPGQMRLTVIWSEKERREGGKGEREGLGKEKKCMGNGRRDKLEGDEGRLERRRTKTEGRKRIQGRVEI